MQKHKIQFGKRFYHLQRDMELWCRENIGPGGWSYDSPTVWEGLEPKVWIMDSAFGTTTFTFKDEKKAAWFALRWGSGDQ